MVNVTDRASHGYPSDAKAHIQWNHVDGPLLICRDGTPHWLTMWERFMARAGFQTADDLCKLYRQEDCKG